MNDYYILSKIDVIMGPIFLGILFLICYFRRKKYQKSPIKRYYFPAFWLRMLGAFLTACMYQYYYNGGDTFLYFKYANELRKLIIEDFNLGFEILFTNPNDYSLQATNFIEQLGSVGITFFRGKSTAMIIKITFFLNIITFNSYLATSFIMTSFAFWGCWKIFLVFYDLYPNLHKNLAIAILFIPSVFFWGTGVMKDSISIAGLGFLFYGSYYLFIRRKKTFSSLLYIIIGGGLAFTIKSYIIAAFSPPLFIWIFLVYEKKIKQKIIRKLLKPILLIIGLGITALFAQGMIESLGFNSITGGIERSIHTYYYIKGESIKQGGTYYDLGDIEPSIIGMLSLAPKAINVALFRPYLWEIGKAINIPAALESLITFFFTIYVLLKVGIIKSFRYIFKNPEIMFCFSFAIVFAFIVGLSSGNFGALARYKIPQLPFYFTGLILLLNYSKNNKNIRKA